MGFLPEYFIVRELGETVEAIAQHMRVAISHTSQAGVRELQQAHALLQLLRKQYAALEHVLAATPLALPPGGDNALAGVLAELEGLKAKIERVEKATAPKRRTRKKGTP